MNSDTLAVDLSVIWKYDGVITGKMSASVQAFAEDYGCTNKGSGGYG